MSNKNIEKLNDNAYFVLDLPSNMNTLISYNHTLANQTISCSYEKVICDENEPAQETEDIIE